jgi:hypothetical protein
VGIRIPKECFYAKEIEKCAISIGERENSYHT